MESRYHSFLVRFWASGNHTDSPWHISLESSTTGEKKIFANLNELTHYFENLMGTPSAYRGDAEGEKKP
jgi:hypothetical protein